MADHQLQGHVLDARPDRIDFRDRTYNPPLVSLPPSSPSPNDVATFLPQYHQTSKILDQGKEGACTGFGLAAVINYMLWDQWIRQGNLPKKGGGSLPAHVSPWMLYDNARVYDEWEGEDYSGSSCRGAMKGWHKHGVCQENLWERRTRSEPRPNPDWRLDAASRPLGAYYRVDSRSITDMQAAIHEVRAVYCSARVHSGWGKDALKKKTKFAGFQLPEIPFRENITGGHAFALVGYTERGFIVQNSWGEKWGMNGFALLTYEDWVQNGDDAWVAAMGAPMSLGKGKEVPAARAFVSMQTATATADGQSSGAQSKVAHWSESRAYEHSIIMGNDGKLLRRLVDTADVNDNLRKVVIELPSAAIQSGKKHVLLYAHGGLNSEKAAIQRAMRMGPWFEANDIHPIFIVWRTSLRESLGQIGMDFINQFNKERDELRSKGIGDLFDKALQKIQNKFDKAFEAAAEKIVGKAVWSQMKQNASAAATGNGGSRQIIKNLQELAQLHQGFSLHFLGHSAGSILLGHMLDDLRDDTKLETVGLYAPACTLDFAIKHYGKALNNGIIKGGSLHIDNLSEKNERDDTVGAYGKSLLYLVSRAFEDPRKMPLLGFERCWQPANKPLNQLKKDLAFDFAEGQIRDVQKWAQIVNGHTIGHTVQTEPEIVTKKSAIGDLQAKATHGSFDNSLEVVNKSVARILNQPKPTKPITDLTGF